MISKRATFFLILIILSFNQLLLGNVEQSDTVFVTEIGQPPSIDGKMNDECWDNINWQAINNVWIDYNSILDSTDFFGQYKIAWSSSSNLLYLLVEIVDDKFVDGWPNFPGDYYHFDIVEIFIDADNSGGLHVFNGSGNVGNEWGTNAENAFSYHINIDLPTDEEYSSECVVNDLSGTSWSNVLHPNYAGHFPEIALREANGKYYWEFSLKVYNDTYDHAAPELSREILENNKVIGFTMAYCDNDGIEESPKTRDHFIGSVWVPETAFNDHWINADWFGTLKLVSTPVKVKEINSTNGYTLNNNYPNPFNPSTKITFSIPEQEYVTIKIYNSVGEEITTLFNEVKTRGTYTVDWSGLNNNGKSVPSGVYYYRMNSGNTTATKKMLLIR